MRVFAALLILLFLPVQGWAGRVALVIGNSQYTTVATLDNPQNDSDAVSRALTAQGFEVVKADNLGRTEMRDTLRRFRAMADRSDIALVYYAGHGIEIGGINYLVPVDARLEDERDAGLEMITVDLVLRQIDGARTLKMVVLDACRNNPFVARLQRESSTRSVNQGLAETRTTQSDTLIAYAAAAGGITPDGLPGENSPFTAAFLKALAGPPADVRRMLGRARDQMRLSVPGSAPFVYSSLGGKEIILNPRSPEAVPAPAATTAPSPGPAENPVAPSAGTRSISVDFVRIDRNGSIADWDEFLIRYESQSTHPLYAFGLEKRAALQRVASTPREATAPTSATAPVTPPASADRNAARSGDGTAPVPPAGLLLVPTMTIDQAARSLQTALKKQACYPGRIDGLFGRNSRRGLAEFSRRAGVPIDLPSSPDASELWAAMETVGAFPDVKCPRVAQRRTPSKPKPAKPAHPAVAAESKAEPEEEKKNKSKIPPLLTIPCPKAEELKFRRPECY